MRRVTLTTHEFSEVLVFVAGRRWIVSLFLCGLKVRNEVVQRLRSPSDDQSREDDVDRRMGPFWRRNCGNEPQSEPARPQHGECTVDSPCQQRAVETYLVHGSLSVSGGLRGVFGSFVDGFSEFVIALFDGFRLGDRLSSSIRLS